MDDIGRQLAFLAKHASNAPAEPAPSQTANHELVRAITKGFGPVIREQLDALRAENALLRQRLDALEARQATTPNIRRVV
jgi:BMFP domain-containing protein YqiC